LSSTEFEFESISFYSPIARDIIELRGACSIFEIYEDIRYPFITATMTVRDEAGFVSGVNITGGETISVLLSSKKPGASPIAKRFYIKRIRMTAKSNDRAESYVLDLIEDVLFESSLQTVNKMYNGKCNTILEKIAQNFLDKEIYSEVQAEQVMKLIVPNLSPLEAMMWIKDRAATIDGYPFYLFSTLATSKLNFLDLGTMISKQVQNLDVEYKYSSVPAQSEYDDIQRRVLKGFEQTNTEDLYSLIRRGLIGAEYEFIDTVKNKRNIFHFDVFKELLDPMRQNVLSKEQQNILYGPNYTYNDKPYNEIKNKRITRIASTSPFKTVDEEDLLAYREAATLGQYKFEVISRAMADFLVKSPITIVANGIDFIDGNSHRTIGNNIRVQFPSSNTAVSRSDDQLDKRLTGDYLIHGAHHLFRPDDGSYDIKLTCVKLAHQSRTQ